MRAAAGPHSGDRLLAPPITAVGLRKTNETIRIATEMRLGINICEPHLCPCGKQVESRGSTVSHVATVLRGSVGTTWSTASYGEQCRGPKIPAPKEPPGLLRSDNKRPDGVTLIPWRQGKYLALDVTMPDTYAQSHLLTTATNVGHAADKSAVSKT